MTLPQGIKGEYVVILPQAFDNAKGFIKLQLYKCEGFIKLKFYKREGFIKLKLWVKVL